MRWRRSTGRTGAPASPKSTADHETRPLVSYRRQWFVVFLIAAVAAWFHYHPPGPRLPPTGTVPPGADFGDWFFILRLPEAPDDAPAQALYNERLHDWFLSLHEAG